MSDTLITTGTRTGGRPAVEVVVEGIDKELKNVGKDLESNWDRVVLCAVKQETLKRLREKVLDEFGEELIQQDKVRFVRLSRFLEKDGKRRGEDEGEDEEEGEDRDEGKGES